MLTWIERVVPQPPEPAHTTPTVEDESPGLKTQDAEPAKLPKGNASGPKTAPDHGEGAEKKVEFAVPEDPASTSMFESVGGSVLSWLSQGLEKVIPQPAQAPGTLQALGKSFETSIDIPDQTEVQILKDEEEDALEIIPFDPEEDKLEACECEAGSDNATENWAAMRVFNWLVQGFERMVPQPEVVHKPEKLQEERPEEVEAAREAKGSKTRVKSKGSISTGQSIPAVVEQAVAETQLGSGATGRGGMFGWFVQELEKVMPQPMIKTQQEAQGGAATLSPVEERGKGA